MHAGAALLADAQGAGLAREDIDFATVLSLANAIALAAEQNPRQAPQAISVLLGGLKRQE